MDPNSFASMASSAQASFSANQETSYANLSCHLINCDSRLEDRITPIKVGFLFASYVDLP